MKDEKMLDEALSRRSLLINSGKIALSAAGLAAVASGGLGLISKAEAKGGSTEKWPWPYVKLDPQKTADLAYEEWYRLFCGGAVISSVFTELREKVGEPFKSFPICGFIFLEGGISGWGTV